jgi:hypothetical protein
MAKEKEIQKEKETKNLIPGMKTAPQIRVEQIMQ